MTGSMTIAQEALVPHPTVVPAWRGDGPAEERRRVLLKLSGEAFGGGHVGLDPDVVRNIAHQIATVAREGIQLAVVVGGGNFFRGAQLQQRGMDRSGPTTWACSAR